MRPPGGYSKTGAHLGDNCLRFNRQGTLMTIAVASFSAVFNIFLAKRLPTFEGIVLFFHILGFFSVRMGSCLIGNVFCR